MPKGEHDHDDRYYTKEEVNDRLKAFDVSLAAFDKAVAEYQKTTDARLAALEAGNPAPEPKPLFPGAPPAGKFLIGASTRNLGLPPGDPVSDPYLKYEKPTGVALSTYRSYATPSQWGNDAGYRKNVIDRDIAAGRIPMPSWKVPGSIKWAQVANGSQDKFLDSIAAYLAGFAPHPVHAILHHEADNVNNDTMGTPADYIAMNAHFRERLELAGATNVSLSLNIIGYMFNPAAARSNPSHPRYMDKWWDPNVFDFASFDPYARDLEDPVFAKIEGWCKANNAPWMIVEWGYKKGTKYGENRDWSKQEVLDFHQRLRNNPLCFGAQVWDSDQNGDNYLVTPGQLEAIRELMLRPETWRYNA